jgi:Protein of unknown function (DUF2917)
MQKELVMSEQFSKTHHLNARDVLDIRDGEGVQVRCLRGVLWITQSNDTEDIVISDGQSFVLDRPGLALVSAPTGPADIIIRAAVDRRRSGSLPEWNPQT